MSGLAERVRFGFGSGTFATRVALRISEGLEFEDWRDIGPRLIAVSDGAAFWIGDWLAYGEWRYGEKYRTALAELELHYDRLRDLAYVAGNVPEAVRRDDLSWWHHRVVAKLVPAEQEGWLARAVEQGWTYRELAQQLRCSTAVSPQTPAAETLEQVKLTIPLGRLDAWQAAADRAGATVSDWAIGVLNAAAAR